MTHRKRCTLREARRAKGWTQTELAKKSGINQQAISALELGASEPMNSTAEALELALGLKPRTLLFEVHPREVSA